MPNIRQHMTVADVADRLSVSLVFVLREIRAGRLAARKLGRDWRIDTDHLQIYLTERTRAGRGGTSCAGRAIAGRRAGSKTCTDHLKLSVDPKSSASSAPSGPAPQDGRDAKRGATLELNPPPGRPKSFSTSALPVMRAVSRGKGGRNSSSIGAPARPALCSQKRRYSL